MPTATYHSSASDGHIHCQGKRYQDFTAQECWDNAHDNDGSGGYGISVYLDSTADVFRVGDRYVTPLDNYGCSIWRGFLYFDTAGLNAAAVITGLTLSLFIEDDGSAGSHQGWSIVVQKNSGGAPHDPLVAGDYLYTQYSGNYGELAQTAFVEGEYNDITLPIEALTPGDTLLLVLRSSFDVDDELHGSPNVYRFCDIWSADKGADFAPKLSVAYVLAPADTTILSNVADGSLVNIGSYWLPAWEQATADARDIASELISVGTLYNGAAGYSIYHGYLYFDTSGLDDEAIIVGAALSLYGSVSWFLYGSDFVVVQSGMPAHPEVPLVLADYDKDFYTSGYTQFNTDVWSNVGYNVIEFDARDFDWINKTGWTKLCIRLRSEIRGTYPGEQAQYLAFWSADEVQAGERRPALYIAYKLIGQATASITCTATVVPRIIARPSLITAAATVYSTALRHTLNRKTLTYTGTLEAGDSVAIDTETMKATHWPASGGAVSVPQYLAGMPLDLQPGTNTIQYADDEAARTVGISIHHKPRDA